MKTRILQLFAVLQALALGGSNPAFANAAMTRVQVGAQPVGNMGGAAGASLSGVSQAGVSPTLNGSAPSLEDAGAHVSRADADSILLSRKADYATPAHEFGHVIGLVDEYEETYNPEHKAGMHVQYPSSLMASMAGKVLPRHFKLAYQLLKRQRLISPAGSNAAVRGAPKG